MTSVVFSTPGLIPIEAFTTFGMSAKPESTNPFGKFGTGLKIAVAVCLRFGQEVIVWRGKDKYTFYTKQIDFRGKEFAQVRMKRETWHVGDIFKKSYVDLPFTTELGKHWELWQAFREFQTNTMDENGETAIWNDTNPMFGLKRLLDENYLLRGNKPEDMTHIVVLGSKFVDEYHDRGRNFLPEGLTVREGAERIQVIEKPSKHIYFRGVRVHDLKEESMYTYNFLKNIDLTEDRTAKYGFQLEADIAEYLMTTEKVEHVEAAVKNPKVGSFERSLPYRYTYATPSSHFTAAATESPNIGAKQIAQVASYVRTSTILTIKIPKSSITDEELAQIEEVLQNMFGDVTTEIQG